MITLISNVGTLVTPAGRGAVFGRQMSDLKVHEDVDLLLRDGRVAAIDREIRVDQPDDIIDADGRAVVPALIDPHRHAAILPISEAAEHRDAEVAFDGEASIARLRRACRRAIRDGVGAMELKCRSREREDEGGGLATLIAADHVASEMPGHVVSTLLLDSSIADGRARDDWISELIGRVIPSAKRRRVGKFCGVGCGVSGYAVREAEAILRAARSAGLRPKLHAEGGETDDVSLLAAKLNAASIDHTDKCGPRAARALRRAGVVSVLLPGPAFLNGRAYPDARGMIGSGLAVALGSDYGLGGRGLESMWAVLAFGIEKMRLSPEEALTACTLNAAAALEMADETGSIEVGKSADVAILDAGSIDEIGFGIGSSPIHEVIIRGRRVGGA